MLSKTAGVKHLVVLINKMDDPTVGWSEEKLARTCPFLSGPQSVTGGGLVARTTLNVHTCHWHCRYEECKTKLTPFLKKVGFNPKTGTITLFCTHICR